MAKYEADFEVKGRMPIEAANLLAATADAEDNDITAFLEEELDLNVDELLITNVRAID